MDSVHVSQDLANIHKTTYTEIKNFLMHVTNAIFQYPKRVTYRSMHHYGIWWSFMPIAGITFMYVFQLESMHISKSLQIELLGGRYWHLPFKKCLISMNSSFLVALSFELLLFLELGISCSRTGPGSWCVLQMGYKMFASILVLLSAISADESWKIFHLGCCIFSW